MAPYYNALPGDLVPVHYDVSIFDIDLNRDTYGGLVKISLAVRQATNRLVLHFRDLTISSVEAKDGEMHSIGGKIVESNTEKEYFVAEFGERFSENSEIVVEVGFSGIIQTNMAGFYRSGYKDGESDKTMLLTQFEATDARRAFPCMDEPALKATFEVHITAPSELTVLGNTPVAAAVSVSNSETITSFHRTPRMSTYLLAWAIGEFEYIESHTKALYADNKPLPVRIYTTRGYNYQAELALELAPKIVDFFSEIFEIKYPLPKLDLIAVHSFSHNAMENWGLITYRSTALLYDPATSSPEYKQKVAYVVAHEIAHQWFGNLVTMQWWDELWLNEGFATWVGYLAVDHLFPDWDIFSAFVSTSLQTALTLDGLRNSHPIKVPVVDALDIDQLFDQISYLKGASTIMMLSGYLGRETFLRGVAIYLSCNKYGNATSDDLWQGLAAASGQDVASMMHQWINSIGFPVVDVSVHEQSLVFTQNRFLNGGGVTEEENAVNWWIPLGGPKDVPETFSEKSAKAPLPTGFFKINKDSQAFIRVNYAPELLRNNVLPHFSEMSSKDKVGIIADVAAIAVSGDVHTNSATFLELVHSVVLSGAIGDDYEAWLELSSRLRAFATIFAGHSDQLTRLVSEFLKASYVQIAENLLLQPPQPDNFLWTSLRNHILNNAATLRIEKVDQLANELFAEWKKSGKIDPALRYFTFSSVASQENVLQDDINVIFSQVTSPFALDLREIALSALGNVTDRNIAKLLMEKLSFKLATGNPVIPTMDAHFLAGPLSRNVAVKDLFWLFFRENYTTLHAEMSTNMVVMDRFVKMTLGNYSTSETEKQVREFFKSKDTHGFERSLAQVLDQIAINAACFDRDAQKVHLKLLLLY